MPKISFILIIACILTVMSCKTEPEDNPFIGTWENADGSRYVFTKTTITVYDYRDDSIFYNGTYTYDDDNITVKFDYAVQILVETYGDGFTSWYAFGEHWSQSLEKDEFLFDGTLLKKSTNS